MIPPTFTERFLWAPQPPATAGENTSATAPLKDGKHEGTLPTFRFTGGVQSTLNSLVALAFSEAEKPRSAPDSVSDIPPEKCLVLSCPTKEGTHIVDAAVRHAANKQGAYVLVLDALELAAGKLGSLGKDGQVLDELYAFSSDTSESESNDEEDKSDNDESPRSQRTRALIDALLCLPTPSTENPDQEPQLSQRRIVYLRDFQYIDKAAKPLLTHILRSLHESRIGTSSRPATILAFGSTNDSESLEIGNTPIAGEDNCLFLNSLFTHARARVADTPARKTADSDESEPRIVIGGADSPPSPGFASFLMSMANHAIRKRKSGDDLEPIPFNSAWGKKVDELATHKLSISVFAENVKSGASEEEWQRASKAKKIERLNQLLLRACLEKKECLLEGDWDEVSFDSVLEGQSDTLLEVVHANSIVTITKGLVADASSPAASSDSESTDTPSPPKLVGLVSEAYKTFKRQQKERSEWENGTSSDGKPKDTYDDVKGIARVLLSCLVDADAISTTFSDVFVDGAIVDSLKTIVTLPLLYPQYFNDGVLSKEAIGGILLYGPPGTGKTMLCRALAKSTGTKMLHIKPSDINDKCVGESEKRIAAVFKLAHRLAPCIIFIDEIDSLFSTRNEHTRTWERNILTEFMQGMDGLKSAKENRDNKIVVVGATNRPYDLDLAILRRMPRRILVDMPNLATRKSILESYFKNEKLDGGINLDQLASQTDGFSGSDLKNLCVAAAMNSVKEAIGPDWSHAAKPSTGTTTSTTGAQSGGHSSKQRKITQTHIDQARNEIPRSSILNKWEDELYKWHEKYSTESKFGKHGSTASATGKGYGGVGSTGRGSDFYSPRYSAGGHTTTAAGMGTNGMMSKGYGSDLYSPKYSAGGNTVAGAGSGNNGMMSKTGLGSDFYSSKYSTDGDTTTATGSGINGLMSKTGLGSDLYSSKYSTDGDNTTAAGSGINGMVSKGGYGGDLFSSKYSTGGEGPGNGINGLMGKGGFGGDLLSSKYSADGNTTTGAGNGFNGLMGKGGFGGDLLSSKYSTDGDTTTGAGNGINGLMGKGGFGGDLFSSKYSADGDTTTGAGNGINGLMGKGRFGSDLFSSKYSADGDTTTGAGDGINGLVGKGGVVDELFSAKFSTDGDATMGNGKGVNGMMPRTGLGSDFYSPTGLAKPGMNGHWNRWAKGGVEENGPRITTLEE